MKLIYNLILIVLMTFIIGQTNCAFSQTHNEIKPEKEVNSKIIPVKNFREKIKLTFPQKEITQVNKEKKDKPKINLINFKKDKNKSLKVDEKTKKHLLNLGVNVGSTIKVISNSQKDVIVKILETTLALNKETAMKIIVAA